MMIEFLFSQLNSHIWLFYIQCQTISSNLTKEFSIVQPLKWKKITKSHSNLFRELTRPQPWAEVETEVTYWGKGE